MMPPSRNRSWGTRALHWLVVAFVLASCVKAWLGPVQVVERASAQIPDSGLQRRQQLEATRETNRLLQQVLTTLHQETLTVRVVEGEAQPAQPVRGRGGGRR